MRCSHVCQLVTVQCGPLLLGFWVEYFFCFPFPPPTLNREVDIYLNVHFQALNVRKLPWAVQWLLLPLKTRVVLCTLPLKHFWAEMLWQHPLFVFLFCNIRVSGCFPCLLLFFTTDDIWGDWEHSDGLQGVPRSGLWERHQTARNVSNTSATWLLLWGLAGFTVPLSWGGC